jgi:hypothetical protein
MDVAPLNFPKRNRYRHCAGITLVPECYSLSAADCEPKNSLLRAVHNPGRAASDVS